MKYILLPIPTARFHTLQRLLRYFSIQRYVKIYKIRPLKRIKWRQFSSDRDFIRRRDGCRQRGIDRFSLLPRCLLRSGSQGPGRVARAANIESRSTSPPVPFSSDSRCLPAAKFIPLNGTCQQTGSSREKASSESVFENSSRQTRVKKKKRKASLLCQSSDYGRYAVWKIFLVLQLWIRLVEDHSPLWDDFVRETDLLDI